MLANMFHPLIPAAWAREFLTTETALALLGWLALFMPAAGTNGVQTCFKGILFELRWLEAGFYKPRGVHSTLVLREEVFPIKVIVSPITLVIHSISVVLGDGRFAVADITTVESQLQVLRSDVTLPLVLRGEGAFTSVVRKAAGEDPFGGRVSRL